MGGRSWTTGVGAARAGKVLASLAVPALPMALHLVLRTPPAAPATLVTEPSAFAGTPGPYVETFPAAATGPPPARSAPGTGVAVTTASSSATLDTPFDHTCAAAVAYLAAHAAPGFVALCPHDAGGHQAATTCLRLATCIPGTEYIWIQDPCPAAYMNEASNSWVLMGASSAPWDPYGYCGQRGNPGG